MNDVAARDYARHLIYFSVAGFRAGSQATFTTVFNESIAPIIGDYPLVAAVCPFDPATVGWVTLNNSASVWQAAQALDVFPELAAARPEQDGPPVASDEMREFTARFAQAMVDGNVRFGWCDDFVSQTAVVCHDLGFVLPPPSPGVSPDPHIVPLYLLEGDN